jgi:drug/metabolite transporter (DMT)-like permease
MLKVLTPYVDAWTSNGIRYPFSSLLWLGPLLYQQRRGQVNPRIWLLALVPTFFNIIAQTLWAWIPYFLDATLMGFLVRISVVFSIGGGFLCFPDERRLVKHPVFWAGVLFSITGFSVMSLAGKELPAGTQLVGIALVLCCGASYGLYAVAVRYSMKGARPWVAFPVISIYTSAAMVALMLEFGEPSRVAAMPPPWVAFFLLSAVIGIAAAHTLFYMAIERLGVAISSSTQLISPFLTFLWSYLFLGESLTLFQWVGGTILLLGGTMLVLSQVYFVPAAVDPRTAPVEPELPD